MEERRVQWMAEFSCQSEKGDKREREMREVGLNRKREVGHV